LTISNLGKPNPDEPGWVLKLEFLNPKSIPKNPAVALGNMKLSLGPLCQIQNPDPFLTTDFYFGTVPDAEIVGDETT